jgi:hypothetical protein
MVGAEGSSGASVRIEKERGGYQEERSFPKSRDPQRSPGQRAGAGVFEGSARPAPGRGQFASAA